MTLYDAPPWEETERGGLNPASYAAIEVFATVTLAIEVLNRAEYDVTPMSVKAMAATLLHIVNTVQQRLTDGIDLGSFTHARLREALASQLPAMAPPPLYGAQSDMDGWVERMTRRVNSIAVASVNLWSEGPGTQPWNAFWNGEKPVAQREANPALPAAGAPDNNALQPA